MNYQIQSNDYQIIIVTIALSVVEGRRRRQLYTARNKCYYVRARIKRLNDVCIIRVCVILIRWHSEIRLGREIIIRKTMNGSLECVSVRLRPFDFIARRKSRDSNKHCLASLSSITTTAAAEMDASHRVRFRNFSKLDRNDRETNRDTLRSVSGIALEALRTTAVSWNLVGEYTIFRIC